MHRSRLRDSAAQLRVANKYRRGDPTSGSHDPAANAGRRPARAPKLRPEVGPPTEQKPKPEPHRRQGPTSGSRAPAANAGLRPARAKASPRGRASHRAKAKAEPHRHQDPTSGSRDPAANAGRRPTRAKASPRGRASRRAKAKARTVPPPGPNQWEPRPPRRMQAAGLPRAKASPRGRASHRAKAKARTAPPPGPTSGAATRGECRPNQLEPLTQRPPQAGIADGQRQTVLGQPQRRVEQGLRLIRLAQAEPDLR